MPDAVPMSTLIWFNTIFNSAKAHNGHCVMPFSQSLPPVAGLIGQNQQTRNGVCMALVNKWVAEHANGRSLWTWLMDRNGTPDTGLIVNVMLNFLDTIAGGGGAATQWRNSERYLKLYNVVRRRDIATGGAQDWTHDFGSPGPQVGQTCAKWLTQHKTDGNLGYYRSFCFLGASGGHITTMWIAQDVAFFDPNFGEYWFERKDDFARWFPTFWSASGYQRTYSKVQFCDWGLSANARR